MTSSRTPAPIPTAPPEGEADVIGLISKESSRDAKAVCRSSVLLNVVLLLTVGVLLFSIAAPPIVPPSSQLDQSRASCSGHGMLFDDAAACECFDCWTGATCSERVLTADAACVVEANSGTPYIFEDYWVRHPEAAVTIKASAHIGYDHHVPRLEAAIRRLHALVGNAVVDGSMHVVVGIGSTELINAALYALADDVSSPEPAARQPALVWTQSPYYNGYRAPPAYFRSRAFEWAWDAEPNASTTEPPHASATRRIIELVTSPNNPDGHLRVPRVHGAHTAVVMDHAYLWPHFVSVGAPAVDYRADNRTIALFTLSKISGHASTRVGWALTSSPTLAARLQAFVDRMSYGSPRENQMRAITILEHIIAHDGALLTHARTLMLSRWERLEAAFAAHAARCPIAMGSSGMAFEAACSGTYQLDARDAATADVFSGAASYAPSPAYAWVRKMDGGDCELAMRSVGIISRPGDQFGASTDFVRLELLMREQTFDILLEKLKTLLGV
jgi:aspartate/methionine/tyrosine aminotransferase